MAGSRGGTTEASERETFSTPEPYLLDGSSYSLTPGWVEGKGKWPYRVQEELQALMIEHELYTYHKLDQSSFNKLPRILQRLHMFIDPKYWNPDIHGPLLEAKVVGKINRIRRDMLRNGTLRQENGGFVLNDTQRMNSQGSLDAFQEALNNLSRDEVRDALDITLEVAGVIQSSASFHQFITRQFKP